MIVKIIKKNRNFGPNGFWAYATPGGASKQKEKRTPRDTLYYSISTTWGYNHTKFHADWWSLMILPTQQFVKTGKKRRKKKKKRWQTLYHRELYDLHEMVKTFFFNKDPLTKTLL